MSPESGVWRTSRFAREAYQCDDEDATHDHLKVLNPSPAEILGDVAHHSWTEACEEELAEGARGGATTYQSQQTRRLRRWPAFGNVSIGKWGRTSRRTIGNPGGREQGQRATLPAKHRTHLDSTPQTGQQSFLPRVLNPTRMRMISEEVERCQSCCESSLSTQRSLQ